MAELNNNLDKSKQKLSDVREETILIQDAFFNLGETLKSSIDEAIESSNDLDDIGKKIAKSWNRDIYNGLKRTAVTLDTQVSLQDKLNRGLNISKDLEKEKEKVKTKINVIENRLSILKQNNVDIDEETYNALAQQRDLNDEILNKLIEQNQANISSLGLTGKIAQGFGGILNKIDKTGSLSSILDIDGAMIKTNKWVNTVGNGVGSLKKGGVFAKNIGKNLISGLKGLDIFSLFLTQLVQAFQQSDKIVGDMAKNLNMSYSEALGVKQEMTSIANSSGNIFITSKGISESFSFIQDQLGISAQTLDNEILTSMTKFREISGMSNETLKGTADLIIGTNQSLEDATGEIITQAEITGLKNGALLNGKKIQEEVSQLSAATTLSLGKQPGELAKAVATAKSLGLEMAKLEGIAGSLLDFESSIENELQAELMLGKNISLEKARQAALDNDMVTLSEEIAKNVGDSAEFSKMNRLQQNALASSLGMNREELAKTLYTQEQLAGYSGDDLDRKQRMLDALIEENGLEGAKEKMKEKSIEDLEKQASMQDRFNASVEKLKEIFTTVAEAIMPVFDLLSGVFNIIGPIFTILNPFLQAALVPLAAIQDVLEGIVYVGKMVANVLGADFSTSFELGKNTIDAGNRMLGSVGAKDYGLKSGFKVGDVISPSKGKTQISTKEGDLLELSENDDLIAAPNITKNINKNFSTENITKNINKNFSTENITENINKNFSTENIVNKDVIQKETTYINDNKETNQLLRQILNKQAKIQMDSTDIGTAFAVNSFEIQ